MLLPKDTIIIVPLVLFMGQFLPKQSRSLANRLRNRWANSLLSPSLTRFYILKEYQAAKSPYHKMLPVSAEPQNAATVTSSQNLQGKSCNLISSAMDQAASRNKNSN